MALDTGSLFRVRGEFTRLNRSAKAHRQFVLEQRTASSFICNRRLASTLVFESARHSRKIVGRLKFSGKLDS